MSDTSDFHLSSTCGPTLAAGQSCALSLQFTPQSAAALSGTLTVTDNSRGVAGTQQIVTLTGTGTPVPLPGAVLSPSSLSFGSAVLHTMVAAQTVTLSNPGSAVLAISGIALSNTADFSIQASTCVSSLQPSASCTVAVAFSPQTVGPVSGTVTLTSNNGGVTGVQQQVALQGTGLPAPLPLVLFSPAQLSFGTTALKTSTTPQHITLSNTGTASLLLSGASLDDPADFALTSSCGSILAVAASCTIDVVFQPQRAGALNATLTLSDNSGGQTGTQQKIPLSGTGMAPPSPTALVAPTLLSFPDTMQDFAASPETFLLTNTGNAALVLSGMTLSDSQDFSFSSTCPAQLAPAASCTVSVGFHPKTVSAFKATLTLADNSGQTDASGTGTAQQTVSLSARGTPFEEPRAAVSPAGLTFPETVAHSAAAAQTVTLANMGTQPLSIASVAVTGPAASAFQVLGGTCTGSLQAGATCTENIVYSPKLGSSGDTASVVFTDNALGQTGATQTVTLSGTALAEIDSVENFGDSVTCGFYAFPNDGTGLVFSLEGYAGLFDTYVGAPAQNWCRQGDTAADLSRLWVPFHSSSTSNGHQLYTLMIGINDAYRYGIPPDALQTYTQEVSAAVTWLALPDTDKVLANTVTQREGTWTSDVGFGLMSTDAGASLSFPVHQAVAGRSLYLVYHVWAQPYGQAGKATIAVDGTVLATVDESSNSSVRIPTENGTYDTYLVQTVPLGAIGEHTVTFTSAGPAGSLVGLLWAGVPQQDYHLVDGAPRVLLGLITNSPSGNQTVGADYYNLQLKSLAPALSSDGMNVVLVPTDRVLDPGTDFNDILHPNNAGHAKLAAAFEKYR